MGCKLKLEYRNDYIEYDEDMPRKHLHFRRLKCRKVTLRTIINGVAALFATIFIKAPFQRIDDEQIVMFVKTSICMEYNPFNKDLEKLTEEDLQILLKNTIAESWFVEYKSALPMRGDKLDHIRITKPTCAFSNTRGGWIFYGIKANDRNNEPTEICGIEYKEFGNLSDRISQIVTAHISPTPFVHSKSIPLANGKIVFVVQVNVGPTPPYITSEGVIYQREDNHNNPIKDRYMIERLSEKTEKYYKSIDRFCRDEYAETKGQADNPSPFLEMYLFPLPFGEFRFENFYSSEFFNMVATTFYSDNLFHVHLKKDEMEFDAQLNLGFNSVYTSHNSIIIRPIAEQNMAFKGTTVELFRNGGLKFVRPIYEFSIENVPERYKNSYLIDYLLNKYSPYEKRTGYNYWPGGDSNEYEYEERKRTDFVSNVKMMDGVEILLSVAIIISKYKILFTSSNLDHYKNIGFRARLENIWRKFIFFDHPEYLEKIKIFNIPLTPKDRVEIPLFANGYHYDLDLESDTSWIIIAKLILDGVGLPDASSIKYEDILTDAFRRFEVKK